MDLDVMDDYQYVLKGRKDQISDRLLKRCVSLDHLGLNKVYGELNGESCLNRNWRGLAVELLRPSPDNHIMKQLSWSKNPAKKLLKMWVESDQEEKSFDVLIGAMVATQVYSSADELLDYLETVNDVENGVNTINDREDVEAKETNGDVCTEPSEVKKPSYKRSKSERLVRKMARVFRRSKSCPDPRQLRPNDVPRLETIKKQDEIFIVSSREDSQTPAMNELVSFVNTLQPVKKGEWTVNTIHSQPRDQMSTAWLSDRVDRSKYVIVCWSSAVKRISDQRNEDGLFSQQSEYNLKFTLNFLITGTLFRNMCYNPGGKFLPILLPGNNYVDIITPLAFFQVYSWPDEKKKIKNYVMEKPEREAPSVGPRLPLVSKQLL